MSAGLTVSPSLLAGLQAGPQRCESLVVPGANVAKHRHRIQSWNHVLITAAAAPSKTARNTVHAANLVIHTSSVMLMPDCACTLAMQANTNTALDQFFPDVQLHTVRDLIASVKLGVVQLVLAGYRDCHQPEPCDAAA